MGVGVTDAVIRWARSRGAVIGMAVVLSGCAGAQYIPTNGGPYAPRPKDCDMEVFSSALPERPYEEIGIVEGEGSWWKSDLADVLPKLREQACLAGGDALILTGDQKYTTGEDNDTPVLRSTATVVRWR